MCAIVSFHFIYLSLGSSRVVDKGDVEEYCDNCDEKGAMSAFEVSAKNGENIKQVFQKLAEQIISIADGEDDD